MNSGRTAFVRYSLRKGLMVVPAVFAAMVVFSAAPCPGAAAATKPGDIVTYSLDGSQPGPITAGPDGNLWFGEYNASSGAADVGKITTTGKITIYSIPGGTGYGPGGITSGPEGDIWFTEVGSDGYIGKITPDGTVTVVAPVAWPREIAPGPGGNLWFTTGAPGEGQLGRLGRISPTGKITIFSDPGIHSPQGITEGPDGNMWFIDPSEEAVGRITPRGNVTTFTSPDIYQPYDITPGPDGALWFTSPGDSTIGRVTTAGAVSTYSGGGIARPFGIATGPDEALWFTGTSEIGRITTGGTISIYYTQNSTHPLGAPDGIARGSDGAMWFTDATEDTIGRITTRVTPEITRFAPRAGGPGTAVTIRGHSITQALDAAFNGVPARIIAHTQNSIIVRLPAGDTAGLVTVTTRAGTATSATPFR